MSAITVNGLHPAALLLEALYEAVPNDLFLEIRPVPVAPGRNKFYLVGDLRRGGLSDAVPLHLAGRANVYFGVLPRCRPSRRASDVAVATCLWADCDRALSAWPEEIPPPSVIVETSPGKQQLYWLLDRLLADLVRVEDLNCRLAHVLGADMAATDRARVLRLPGFANMKYPERPVARLVTLERSRKYDPHDFLRSLPLISANPRSFQRPIAGRAEGVPSYLPLVFEAIVNFLEAGSYRPRPSGDGNYKSLCPLHEDHEPSLAIHPVRGWKCFGGCGEGRLTMLAARLHIRVSKEATR